MREILFRGFTPDERGKSEIIVNGKTIKGQWVQGSYWRLEKTTYCFKEDYEAHPDNTEHYIVFSQMTDWGLPNQQLKADVIPETVGQYTGLTDKNGKRIFEGDILKIARVSDSIGSHYFPPLDYPVNVIVKWDLCAWMWETLCKDKRYIGFPDAWCHYKCEVIGNIYDNPELLKGE